jgi:preprotein translocase SecE subunit
VFLTKYLREAREELKKVSWPRWLDTRNNTLLVIGISVFLAALLGLADIVFSNGLQYLLTLKK